MREAFKKGGMRTQERQLTYAIEHTKQLQAWNPWSYAPKVEDQRPWLEKLAGKSESLFSYVLSSCPRTTAWPQDSRCGVSSALFQVLPCSIGSCYSMRVAGAASG